MKIVITFKRKPGTKDKDRVIEMDAAPSFKGLTDARELWEVEQKLNALTTTRVHIELRED